VDFFKMLVLQKTLRRGICEKSLGTSAARRLLVRGNAPAPRTDLFRQGFLSLLLLSGGSNSSLPPPAQLTFPKTNINLAPASNLGDRSAAVS
jgi:hypothetical protein